MTYNDCIKIASLYLEDSDLYDFLNGRGMDSDKMQKKIKQLCSFVELIANEISCEYFPITKTEKITAKNGWIEYERLSEIVVDVRSVKKNGVKVNYDLFVTGVEVDEDGEYEVCYEYSPKNFMGDPSEKIDLYGRITPRVVALGTVAEYCLANGRYEEAITYDKAFKDALIGVEKCRGKLKVKGRRWA